MENDRCQRPERAYFISTVPTEDKGSSDNGGVNALNGLTSFLPRTRKEGEDERMMCQRPERAYFISTVEDSNRR